MRPRRPAAPIETPAVAASLTVWLVSTLASWISSRTSLERSVVSREKRSPRLAESSRTSRCRCSIVATPTVWSCLWPTRNDPGSRSAGVVSGPGRRGSRRNATGVVIREERLAVRDVLRSWPVLRQVRDGDVHALGLTARSRRSERLRARTDTSERVVPSVCPYCAVGCGQRIFVQDGRITQIDGDPESPISRGRLCPKGAATRSLVQAPGREYKVKYRRPHGTEWEDLPLEQAMDMIADRVIAARAC